MTPSIDPRSPNLFIIGASKCGTSALHSYLNFHPEICLSEPKEPCFFVDHAHLTEAWPIMARQAVSHDLEAYLAMFESGRGLAYRGEASVYYSQAPHREGCARRIHDFSPEARIIYLVKEPVGRAIGHYWQRFKEFQESLALDEAIRRNAIYRDTSDYALQLSQYLDWFDEDRIHIVDADDLRLRRRETLNALFAWLRLTPFDYTDDQLVDLHVSPPTSRVQRFPFVRAVRDSGAWAQVRRHVPTELRKMLARAGTRTIEKSTTDETSTRDWLSAYFEPRIAEFESLSGRTFLHWRRTHRAVAVSASVARS